MELQQFAKNVLLSAELETKLHAPAAFSDASPTNTTTLPEEPVRLPQMRFSRAPRTDFPRASELDDPNKRAAMLHVFANHELMALELMAVALLKMTDAPAAFRRGIAKTMLEEQRHFQLYRRRVNELGFEFGDLEINDFFWKALSSMSSPMDYVTCLSMTFEQANLDYARHYGGLFERVGDQASARIMDEIYDDEVGHLAFGLGWFNQWRQVDVSLWDAYRENLPDALSPAWAKGIGYCVEGRRQAGLPTDFIRQLSVYSRSKSRPARVLLFNPESTPTRCDHRDARARDLAPLGLFVANRSDVVVGRRPTLRFLDSLCELGVAIPEFLDERQVIDTLSERRHLDSIIPARWTPQSKRIYAALQSRILPKNRRHGSPDESITFGNCPPQLAEHLARPHLGESKGSLAPLDTPIELIFCLPAGAGSTRSTLVRSLPASRAVDEAYVIGEPLSGLPAEATRFLHDSSKDRASPLASMKTMADWLRAHLGECCYHGPLAVRITVGRGSGGLAWRLRSTELGLSTPAIAASLAEVVGVRRTGLWLHLPTATILRAGFATPSHWVAEMAERLPRGLAKGRGRVRLNTGIMATTDATQSESLLTALLVSKTFEDLMPLYPM